MSNDFNRALELAAHWCEQQTGEFAQYFTPENAAAAIRAMREDGVARVEQDDKWSDISNVEPRPPAERER